MRQKDDTKSAMRLDSASDSNWIGGLTKTRTTRKLFSVTMVWLKGAEAEYYTLCLTEFHSAGVCLNFLTSFNSHGPIRKPIASCPIWHKTHFSDFNSESSHHQCSKRDMINMNGGKDFDGFK